MFGNEAWFVVLGFVFGFVAYPLLRWVIKL